MTATDMVLASLLSSLLTITPTTLMMASSPFSFPTLPKAQTVSTSVPSMMMPGMPATITGVSVTMASGDLTALLLNARPQLILLQALASTAEEQTKTTFLLSQFSSGTSRDVTALVVESVTTALVFASALLDTMATNAKPKLY
jgi:hypothetical protein